MSYATFQMSHAEIRKNCGSSNQSAVLFSHLNYLFSSKCENGPFERSDSSIAKALGVTERQIRYARKKLIEAGYIVVRLVRKGLHFITEYLDIRKLNNISCRHKTKLSLAPDKIVDIEYISEDIVNVDVDLDKKTSVSTDEVKHLIQEVIQKAADEGQIPASYAKQEGRLAEEAIFHVKSGIQNKGLAIKQAVVGFTKLLRTGRFRTPVAMSRQLTKLRTSSSKNNSINSWAEENSLKMYNETYKIW